MLLQRFYKKAAAFVLRSVAKHSPELAQAVVDSGALEALVLCLEEFDPSVKESAAWALGYIASHTAELAQACVDAGSVPLLVLCIQEPEITLKRIAASALNDISKHSPELAQAVVDAGAVAYLAPLVQHDDGKLKRQVCSCLAQIAKHSVDLAEVVVEAEIFPKILTCLADVDVYVRKNAATAVREIAKHTPEVSKLAYSGVLAWVRMLCQWRRCVPAVQLAKLIVNSGGAAALVDYVRDTKGNVRLPGIMALGFISAFSETLALAVIVARGVPALKDALINEPEDHVKAATVWTLGQIGRHTPDHARAIAEGGVMQPMVQLYVRDDSSPGTCRLSAALGVCVCVCGLLTDCVCTTRCRLEDEGEARIEGGYGEVHGRRRVGAAAEGCGRKGAEVCVGAVCSHHPQRRRGKKGFHAVWPSPARAGACVFALSLHICWWRLPFDDLLANAPITGVAPYRWP